MTEDYGKWFSSAVCREQAESRLFCFPYAGAGATVYLEWQRSIPENMDFFPVSYPMREKRRNETMPSSLKELAFQIALENEKAFSEKPCIFFGHCEGGIIAFETASAIKELYGISPVIFVASGVNPPCVPLAISIDETMDFEEASRRFTELRFIPEQFSDNQLYLKCFVPVLLEDFVLFQKYLDSSYYKLDCPILEVHGEDDFMIQKERINEWDKYTVKNVIHKTFPGEHFYINNETLPLLLEQMR